MIYEYKCKCGHEFEVIKKVAERNDTEHCLECHQQATRRHVPSKVLLQTSELADWNTDEHYNPGLGVKVKNNLHAKKIAKQKGLTEIGTEDPNKAAKKFEQERKKKAKFDISEITNIGEIKSK